MALKAESAAFYRTTMRILPTSSANRAFTLVELVITTAISTLLLGGSIYGYIMSTKRAEWAAYSLAAHSLAMQRIEQARAAKWDPQGFPPVDELTNRPPVIDILDIPMSGMNIAYATSTVSIVSITATPPLKKIRVDCVWPFMGRSVFTNTVVTYRAPDQ